MKIDPDIIKWLLEGDPVIRWQVMRDLTMEPENDASNLLLILRGSDSIRKTRFINDPRLEDTIQLVKSRRNPKGVWSVEKRIPGITFFDMEKLGSQNR